ncbi:MAG: hypothetical protein K940chlam7_00726 [Chlamydiae bacterium]|nr:hypothetical protein [Chlamydiota bacterium]
MRSGVLILEESVIQHGLLSPEAVKELEDFAKKISDEASDIEGVKRFEVIHEDEMWDPEKVIKRPMAFTSTQTGESALAVSSFHAAGPGSSSMIPRNRTRKTAYAANFFETGLAIKVAGQEEEPQELMGGVTRSAITVEFDQKDKDERAEANLKLNQQVLDAKVKQKLDKMTWEELEDAGDLNKPIILKSQTVNLLTTDRLRYLTRQSPKFANLAKKIHEGLSGSPADDERSLALENLAAHKELNGQTVPYIVEDSEGIWMTIHVKYDLRYFNIPNNILQEKMPELLTSCPELEEANAESWSKLEEDVWSQFKELDELIGGIRKTGISSEEQITSEEKQWLRSFFYACKNKIALREEIMEKTIGKESLKGTGQEFEEWQAVADDVANRIAKMRKNPSLSVAMKAMLPCLDMKENLRDLYLDTRELYLSGLWKDPTNMDNNRSALATRIIALGALVKDLGVHFGCRSGKDRTGLVDIELKLLLTEAFLNHRMPSYREEERMEDIVDHRETMTLESGNVQDIIRATMGASIGINTVGSAVKPLNEKDPRGEQLVQTTKASQAGQKMVIRPKTKLPIKPGYLEKHDTTIVVKHAG